MKKIFVTYLQNNQLKKAEITESKYTELNNDISVTQLTIYSSKLLMEQNYQNKISGSSKNKNFLHG